MISAPERPLSARQGQLLRAIDRLAEERGFPPSLAEVAAAMGVATSRVGQLAKVMVRRGRLTHEPKIPRSWRVVPQ